MEIRFLPSINDINAVEWDSLNTDAYPFTRHAFLSALEDSQSCCRESGWQPYHITLYEQDKLLAAMPLYLKNHSYGEYVFDWSWADAYHRHGKEYYPKLISCIPFTPATGPRLLCKRDTEEILPVMLKAIIDEAERLNCSSWHCLFSDKISSDQLAELGISQRLSSQFHWFNENFSSFDDFLSTFNARKRKSLKRERRKVQEQGITLKTLTGDQISADQWDFFYQLYHLTYLKRSGRKGYLNAEFFSCLSQRLPDQVMMVIAEFEGRMVAGALNFFDDTTLYGRYWGCSENFDFLHFEACYYQGLEFAIQRGLQRFDPGAQGEHKIQRGFKPVETWSNHWIADEQFREAIDRFLLEEAQGVRGYIADAHNYLPFKNTDSK